MLEVILNAINSNPVLMGSLCTLLSILAAIIIYRKMTEKKPLIIQSISIKHFYWNPWRKPVVVISTSAPTHEPILVYGTGVGILINECDARTSTKSMAIMKALNAPQPHDTFVSLNEGLEFIIDLPTLASRIKEMGINGKVILRTRYVDVHGKNYGSKNKIKLNVDKWSKK